MVFRCFGDRCFFHTICATDNNFGIKNIERTKLSTLKTLIFANFWGPEVVGSSSYQNNIGAKFIHLYIYLHCVRSSSWCATTLATLLWGHPQGNTSISTSILHQPQRYTDLALWRIINFCKESLSVISLCGCISSSWRCMNSSFFLKGYSVYA